jgi:ABC-type polysaccharide/polyol phosphate transport system ATPase subunit
VSDIVVDRISKRYRIPRLREPFWALRGVSFEVGRGEALGVVGANGSGKTTLIRLLCGITTPTEGEVRLDGRLSGLVDVGAGFHPDLTGRENIFLNGAILGMSYREIERKIGSIVEFAGIGPFLHLPVKKYSSGMYVRLGFAISVHLDTDILLLDEVLAVGDIEFQARCFDRIGQLRDSGKTIVLVSHDLAAIERLCDRALLLAHGEVTRNGDPRAIIEAYQEESYRALPDPGRGSTAQRPIVAARLTFEGHDGGPARTGDPLTCRLAYEASRALGDVVFTVSFNWPSGYLCTEISSGAGANLEAGPGEVEFTIPLLVMQRGFYSVDVAISRGGGERLDWRPRCSLLRVDPGRIIAGDFYQDHRCQIRPHPTGAGAKVQHSDSSVTRCN